MYTRINLSPLLIHIYENTACYRDAVWPNFGGYKPQSIEWNYSGFGKHWLANKEIISSLPPLYYFSSPSLPPHRQECVCGITALVTN